MFRLAVDTPVTLGLAGFRERLHAGSFLWIVNNIYFQYYSLLIFLICVATMIVVSYATPPPPEGSITGLTYATVTPEQKRETRRSWNRWDVVNSGRRAGADSRRLSVLQRMSTQSAGGGGGGGHLRGQQRVLADDGRRAGRMAMHRYRITLAAVLMLTASPAAQWLHYPTAGIPRTPDGKPNLAAPVPRTPDGKPDRRASGGRRRA